MYKSKMACTSTYLYIFMCVWKNTNMIDRLMNDKSEGSIQCYNLHTRVLHSIRYIHVSNITKLT